MGLVPETAVVQHSTGRFSLNSHTLYNAGLFTSAESGEVLSDFALGDTVD